MVMISVRYSPMLYRRIAWAEAIATTPCFAGHGLVETTPVIAGNIQNCRADQAAASMLGASDDVPLVKSHTNKKGGFDATFFHIH